MRTNREIARDAFAAWATGAGSVTGIFAPDMTWEIVGRSAVSRRFEGTQQFIDGALRPLNARFGPTTPFRPVDIRGIYADDERDTVVVVWDGQGTTVDGTTYRDTSAWVLTFRDGEVVDGTAFFDSLTVNELWENVKPAE